MTEAVNETGREAAHQSRREFMARRLAERGACRKYARPRGIAPPERTVCYEWRVPRLLLALMALGALILLARPEGAARAQGTGELAWSDCGGGFECATLSVPLDYSAPNGTAISLALTRMPARDSGQRLGSLFVNPGGPGASGVDFVRAWAGSVSGDVRDRFDLVGFDPRGIGQSTPIVCHDNLQAYIAADPTPDSQAEWDNLEQQTKTLAEGCAQRYGTLLQHVGTKDVARDLDRMRAAVGDTKLTYLGYSYGTVIGQVYADMFPRNVRAIVLDGAVDLALSPDERTLTQAAGFERALQNFLADCRAKACDLTSDGDPEQAVDELLAKAEEAPIPARGADRPAGPGETLLGIASPLYSQQGWPALDRAITSGLDGNGAQLVRLTDSYLERNGDGSYPNLTEANLAVNCVDQAPSKLPVTFDQYQEQFPKLEEVSKHFGAAFATGLSCEYWGAKPDPLSTPKASGSPPLLVVDTTGDPATPYEWGRRWRRS